MDRVLAERAVKPSWQLEQGEPSHKATLPSSTYK
jgi:hypothetical protein